MKIVLKIIHLILHMFLCATVFAFFFSLGIRPVFQDVVKKNVIQNRSFDILYSALQLDVDKVHLILESKNVDPIIDQYIDISIDGIIDSSSIQNIHMGEDIFNYVKEHREELEKELSIEIDSSVLEDVDLKNQIHLFDSQFQSSLAVTSDQLSNNDKSVLRLYQVFVSKDFRYLLLLIFFISLILTIVLNRKDFSKMLKNLAADVFMSGLFLVICSLFLSFSLKKVGFSLNVFDVAFMPYSFICFGVGLVFFILYFLFHKNDSNLIDEA